MGFSVSFEGIHILYAAVTLLMAACTTVFSREYLAEEPHHLRYWTFVALTLAATLGVFLSADMMTAYVCFEIVSMASYPMVAQEETDGALRAGRTYITISVIGGMVALMGMFLLYRLTGTFAFDELAEACAACENRRLLAVSAGCLLFGFGAKAGMFPLHIWLPEAHPVAPAPASALLSGLLTKVGIYGILAISVLMMTGDRAWGLMLLWLGVVTMLVGAVLAILSVDLKRIIACSSVSQIGFILVGTSMTVLLGEEGLLAARGTVLHMINHSMFKLTLFLCAGIVVMNTHTLDLNRLRGYGKGRPFLAACFLSGALGIAGVPLFSGFVSKSLLHEAIVEYAEHSHMASIHVAEWLFLLAGGMTFAYMLKILTALFLDKGGDAAPRPYAKLPTRLAVAVPAVLIPVLGMLPSILMDRIADLGETFLGFEGMHTISYFTGENFKGAAISLGIGTLLYFTVVRGLTMQRQADGEMIYVNHLPSWLSLERKFYRPLIEVWLPNLLGTIASWADRLPGWLFSRLMPAVNGAAKLLDSLPETVFPRFMQVLGFCAEMLDLLPELLIAVLKRTVYRERRPSAPPPVGNRASYALGRAAEWIVNAYTRLRRGSRDKSAALTLRVVKAFEDFHEENRLIVSSLSFAMLMACVGMFLILAYLLLVRYRLLP